jgi:succinate dehydrogenase/fumarate reductase-like Fe-S protein
LLCFFCWRQTNKEHNTENLKDYQYRCQEKQTQNEDKQNKEHNTEGFLCCILCFVCLHSVFSFFWHLYW